MERGNPDRRENNGWLGTAGLIAGTAAVAGGFYWLATRGESQEKYEESNSRTSNRDPNDGRNSSPSCSILQSLSNLLSNQRDNVNGEGIVQSSSVPDRPYIMNLNTLLSDIYVRHVALKDDDFRLHYKVFSEVFANIHRRMKDVDDYYNRYSSNVQYAGSHYDRLKIKKPDEFDVDIVIGLPVNMDWNNFNREDSDIVIEQKYPGYVQLRGGVQYKNIVYRDGADVRINKTAHSWLDDRNYILRSKFTDWFKSVGNRALNTLEQYNNVHFLSVDGVRYFIRQSSSGPAWTLLITAPGFKLDVDLVPALKFPESRWPVGRDYREIPLECSRNYWMVVPKPNKSGQSLFDENRSWRIALQDQENKLLYKTEKMRTVICLIKYLRDSLGMDRIASYYIKTIFFNEIIELQWRNPYFWQQNDLETCYIYMVEKFYNAICAENIPYFWNRNLNLISNLNTQIKNEYKRKLSKVTTAFNDKRNYKNIARCILAPDVYAEYENLYF